MCVGHKESVPDIVKPASFKTQEFRRVVLENGIEFVLVSDAEIDKAGAAIDVRCIHTLYLLQHDRDALQRAS